MAFERSIAIVIGINHYSGGIPELENAADDARQLAEILEREHGYEVVLRLDEEGTLKAVTDLLDRYLPVNLGANDRVLFYFAGHGIAIDGDDGPVGYVLPQDAVRDRTTSFLAMQELHSKLLALPCRHLLAILDCCFAGALRWSSVRALTAAPARVYRQRYQRYVDSPAWQVIASTAQDERAFDLLGKRGGGNGHSPFAAALFDGLAGAADLAPAGGDGLITATELYLYLRDHLETQLPLYGVRQTPGFWPMRKHGKGEYLFVVPGRALELPEAPSLSAASNPWRGLEAYETAHSGSFYGREAAISQLMPRIERNGFTVIVGPSGSGKSSLVRAGITWRLREKEWTILPVIRPGASPLKVLDAALAQRGTDGVALLIVDQLEEVMTQCRERTERDAFMERLAKLARDSGMRIVATVRSGFEPVIRTSVLAPVWGEARFLLPPMTRAEMRQAIERPAEDAVLYFEPPALVEQMIDEVADAPGGLPLLSFALSELYLMHLRAARGDRAITKADYDALGGVAGSLSRRAEEEYGAGNQAAIESLLLRMLTFDAGAWARRRVPVSELQFESLDENQAVTAAVQQLVTARLLVAGQMPNGEPCVEPAHEELIHGWPRLQSWIRDQSDRAILQRRVTQAANDWDGKSARQLWDRDARLRQAREMVAQPYRLNRAEREFVRRSEARRVRTRNYAIAGVCALALLAGAAKLYNDRQQRIQASLESVGLAQRLAGLAPAIQMSGRRDELAALLARQAYLINQREGGAGLAQVDQSLRTVLSAPYLSAETAFGDFRAKVLAYSPDGSEVLAVAEDGTVYRWDRAKQQASPRRVYADPNADKTKAPAGAWGESGPVAAWVHREDTADSLAYSIGVLRGEMRNPEFLPLPKLPVELSAMQISSDGRWLAIATSDGKIEMRDLQRPNAPSLALRGGGAQVSELALSFHGDLLALAGEDGFVRIYPTNHPGTPRELRGRSTRWVYTLAFSPNGKWLAAGGEDRTVRLWDITTRDPKARVSDLHIGGIYALAFSEDGKWLASGSNDQRVRIWPTKDFPALMETLSNGTTGIAALAFDHAGESFVSGGDDQTARLWRLQPSPAETWQRATGATVANAVVVDQSRLYAGCSDHKIRIWKLDRTGAAPEVLEATDWVFALARPAGTSLLIAGTGKKLEIWDLAHPDKPVWTFPGHVSSVASDGAWVAAAHQGTPTEVWDLKHLDTAPALLGSGLQLSFAGTPSTLMQLMAAGSIERWSPPKWKDASTAKVGIANGGKLVSLAAYGNQVAAGATDGSLYICDVTRQECRHVQGSASQILALQFDPSGKLLAVGSEDGTVQLWDLARLGNRPIALHAVKAVWSLAFTANSDRLAAGDDEGNVYLWPVSTAFLADNVCDFVRRNLSLAEWQEYLGASREYRRTCSNLPSGTGAPRNAKPANR